jgi:hypothetical protein
MWWTPSYFWITDFIRPIGLSPQRNYWNKPVIPKPAHPLPLDHPPKRVLLQHRQIERYEIQKVGVKLQLFICGPHRHARRWAPTIIYGDRIRTPSPFSVMVAGSIAGSGVVVKRDLASPIVVGVASIATNNGGRAHRRYWR